MDQTINHSAISKHATYSAHHLQQSAAESYQGKFSRSFTSRLSNKREIKIVSIALQDAIRLSGIQREKLSILDYPCGAGRFAKLFASTIPHYTAGDHSPHMVNLTVQTLRNYGLEGCLRGTTVGDLRKTTLKNNSVDLVACMRLLHHFPVRADRITILTELRRVSSHGMLVSFLNGDSVKQRWYKIRRRIKGKPATRVLISMSDFKEEAAAAGWKFVNSWQLSSLCSGICVALLSPADA